MWNVRNMALTRNIAAPADTVSVAAPRVAGKAHRSLPWPVWIYLLCVVLPLGFHVGPLAMTTLRFYLIPLTIPLVVITLSGSIGRVLVTDWLFVLHVLWATLALAVNNPDRAIEQAGSVGIEFLGGYFVGRVFIRSRANFIALSKALVTIVLCLLPFSLVEAMTGRHLAIEILRVVPGLSTIPVVDAGVRLGLHRVQSVFAHPIHYGLFCSVAFSLAFVALKGISGDVWRWLSTGLVGFASLLALSSGALLAVFLQIGLIAWAATFARFRWRWWLLAGLIGLAFVAVDLLSSRSPVRVFMSYATFSPQTAFMRSLIFEWGMVNVWANPIFGIGLDDWVRLDWMHSSSIDNYWLVVAMRYGIPGFLLLAIGYLIILIRIMRLDLEASPQLNLIRRAWVFTFLGLTFTLMTVHIWNNIHSFVFFMFGSGLWLISAPTGRGMEDRDESAQERPVPAASGSRPTGVSRRQRDMPPGESTSGRRFSRFSPGAGNDHDAP